MWTKRILLGISTIILSGSMMIPNPVKAEAQQAAGLKALAWGPDGRRIATIDFNGVLRIWDATSKQLLLQIKDPAGRIDTISWNPSGTRITSLGGEDGVLRIWSTSTGALIANLPEKGDANGLGVVTWSPDGTRIASVLCSESGPINIWSVDNDTYKLVIKTGPAAFYGISWNPDSTKLTVEGIVSLYVLDGIRTGHVLFHVIGPFLLPAVWDPTGTKIAAGDITGPIHLIDAKSGKELTLLQGQTKPIFDISWNPDGIRLVSASQDRTLIIWDTNAGKSLETVPLGYDELFLGVLAQWSPYGGRLAYHVVTSTNLSTPTQDSPSQGFNVIVPLPSLDELEGITKRCAKEATQQNLITQIASKQFLAFVNKVKAMPKDQMPPACAADLIAIANALQSAQ